MLALLDTPQVVETLKVCGADLVKLRRDLKEFIDDSTPRLRQRGRRRSFTRRAADARFPARAAAGCVPCAVERPQGGVAINVLVAIFGEKQSQAVFLLGRQEVARLDVVNFVSHGLSKVRERSREADDNAEADGEGGGEASPLERFTTNLNHWPRRASIDPLIGRQLEVERTVEVLCRRRKNNPLLLARRASARPRLPKVSRG